MGTSFTRPRGCPALLDGEVLIGTIDDLEAGLERIDTRGLQPLIRPVRQIPAAGAFQRGEQVVEGGVLPGVCREMGAYPGKEGLQSHVGGELLEHACSLGVGDAVEVGVHGDDIGGIGEHRVGGGQLVLGVGPGLFFIAEGYPGGVEAGSIRLAHGGGPGGEGLVEPQVIPPGHRDQIAKPHVRQLVEDRVRAALVLIVAGCRPEDVFVADCYHARVLHRAHVVLRAEHLVVLVEGIGDAEVLGVVVEALLRDGEQLFGIQVLGQGLAAVQAQRNGLGTTVLDLAARARLDQRIVGGLRVSGDLAAPFVGDLVPRANTEGDQIGGQQVIHLRAVQYRVILSLGGDNVIGHDSPRLRGTQAQRVGGLDVRLVEAGEDALGVGGLELGVEVNIAVRGVLEAVQPLARDGIIAQRVNHQLMIAGSQIAKDDARGGVVIACPDGSLGDVLPIEVNRVHLTRPEIHESGTSTGSEVNRGAARELLALHIFAGGKIQLHGVVDIGDQLGAGLSFSLSEIR